MCVAEENAEAGFDNGESGPLHPWKLSEGDRGVLVRVDQAMTLLLRPFAASTVCKVE